MQESQLETQVKQSRFSRIVDEFRQWIEPENRPYFDDHFDNAIKILFGYRPINYRVISHGNKLIHHGWLYDREAVSRESPFAMSRELPDLR